MTYDDDQLDRLLRRLPAPGVPDEVRDRHLAQLREVMAAESTPARPSRPASPAGPDEPDEPRGRTLRRRRRARGPLPRRRRVVVALVAAGAVVLSGTAAATIAWQRAHDRSEVHCYPIWTTDFDNPSLGGDAISIPQDSASVAIDMCRSFWAQGYLTSIPPYTEPKGQSPVPAVPPPLIACVLPKGIVGVFPAVNQETCAQLGLPTSEG